MLWIRSILCTFIVLFLINSSCLYAATPTSNNSDAFIGPLCNVVVKIQGPWGKALLVIGAIFVGVNVFIGKFSFPMLIGFVAAGALIMSPEAVINVMGGQNFKCSDYSTTTP